MIEKYAGVVRNKTTTVGGIVDFFRRFLINDLHGFPLKEAYLLYDTRTHASPWAATRFFFNLSNSTYIGNDLSGKISQIRR